MIRVFPALGREGLLEFHGVPAEVYRQYPHHRATEDDVARMLVGGRSAYHGHADVRPFLLVEDGRVKGRVAMIHDRNLPGYVQAAFFEALPDVDGAAECLRRTARSCFPGVRRMVVGLNAHLNYSAGILLEPFDRPPLFGFNWTPPYYPRFFEGFEQRTLVSFRFDNGPFYSFAEAFGASFDPGEVRVRDMDRGELAREVAIYTGLNNACFPGHVYWSDRAVEEDLELFHPFRFLMKEENLIFAEVGGRPVGFLLWYPDFNELVRRNDREIGLLDVARYRLANPIRTVRLTEIAVLPEHRRGPAVPAMILRMIAAVRRGPYEFCEGGFIFEENRSSIGMTLKYIARAFGRGLMPFRKYAVFECGL